MASMDHFSPAQCRELFVHGVITGPNPVTAAIIALFAAFSSLGFYADCTWLNHGLHSSFQRTDVLVA